MFCSRTQCIQNKTFETHITTVCRTRLCTRLGMTRNTGLMVKVVLYTIEAYLYVFKFRGTKLLTFRQERGST